MSNNNNISTSNINPTTRFNMSDLVYNIQTKISLLSQIEQNANNLQKSILIKDSYDEQKQEQVDQFMQINLPMQILNKKMMNILNNNKQEHHNHNERTLNKMDRKRMNIQQLQTGTKNVDEIKKNIGGEKSGVQLRNYYNTNSNNHNNQSVKQFNQNNSQLYNNEPLQQISTVMTNSQSISKSSSKIVNKFNSIEINYMDKIKTLSFKVTYLQQKLQQSQQQKKDIMQSLETYKSLYTRKQQQINTQMEKRLQQIKSTLIEKFADQCRLKYTQYINQLKQITNLLNEQSKKRKLYQSQNKVLKLQKENYQQMYKSLLKKQKEYLKIDIDKTKNQLTLSDKNYMECCDYSQIDNKNCTTDSLVFDRDPVLEGKIKNNRLLSKVIAIDREQEKVQNSNSKPKNKSTNKNKSKSQKQQRKSKGKQTQHKTSTDQRKSLQQTLINSKKQSLKSKLNPQQHSIRQEMTKQQLIPFLAKGIQQLKQRLKMN